MKTRLFGASRVRTRCVAPFKCSSTSVTCLYVILPCFSKELKLYMHI